MSVVFSCEPYTGEMRTWIDRVGKHYLSNAPPGAMFSVAVRRAVPGLFGSVGGELVGVCVVGRPVARKLPQDGSVGEITRMVLVDGLPYGTASAVLRFAGEIARRRGMARLIAYHDRTRHTGCIYRKAGFRKDGVTNPPPNGWATRAGRVSGDYVTTSKRRWVLIIKGGSRL